MRKKLKILKDFWSEGIWTNLCKTGVFSFIILLLIRWPIESKLSWLLYANVDRPVAFVFERARAPRHVLLWGNCSISRAPGQMTWGHGGNPFASLEYQVCVGIHKVRRLVFDNYYQTCPVPLTTVPGAILALWIMYLVILSYQRDRSIVVLSLLNPLVKSLSTLHNIHSQVTDWFFREKEKLWLKSC